MSLVDRWGGQVVDDVDDDDEKNCCNPCMEYLADMKRGNQIGSTIALILYALVNIALLIERAGQ